MTFKGKHVKSRGNLGKDAQFIGTKFKPSIVTMLCHWLIYYINNSRKEYESVFCEVK